jgi:hypothetical protein
MVGHLGGQRKGDAEVVRKHLRPWDMLKLRLNLQLKPRHAAMRLYLRHPTDVPIHYRLGDVAADCRDHLRNIGRGGLCFKSHAPLSPGAGIHIEILITEPVFQADGVVVWCHASDGAFEVGVRFEGAETDYSVRMVEQVCQIEHYRQEVLKAEGRELTSEQAALEWIQKSAARFPR